MSTPTSVQRTAQFSAHGFDFVITCPDRALTTLLDEVLVDMIAPAPPSSDHVVHVFSIDISHLGPSHYRLCVDGTEEYATLAAEALIAHLLIEVNARAAARPNDRIMLHAGCVRLPPDRDPGLVLVPGASHSGKTTLCTALALQGWTFVADEVSALHPSRHTVQEYGKPVALRPWSASTFAVSIPRLRTPATRFETDERFVPPRDLKNSSLSDQQDVPVRLIVFPTFAPSTAFEITKVAPAQALTQLMQSILHRSGMTEFAFRSLERLVQNAPAISIRHGNVTDAVHDLCTFDYTA